MANQHKVNVKIGDIVRSQYIRTTAIEFVLTTGRGIQREYTEFLLHRQYATTLLSPEPPDIERISGKT